MVPFMCKVSVLYIKKTIDLILPNLIYFHQLTVAGHVSDTQQTTNKLN